MKRFLLTALLLGTSASAVTAAPTPTTPAPAGSVIVNQAFFDALNDAGQPISTPSNQVTLTVQAVPAFTVSPQSPAGAGATPDLNGDPALVCGQRVLGRPGEQAALPYVLTNTGNVHDSYSVSSTRLSAALPGPAQWYVDDGDRTFTPQDAALTSVALDPGQSVTLYAAVPVPAQAQATDRLALSPIVTSESGSSTTGNHVGCIQVTQVLGVSLSKDEAGTTTSPGSAVYDHVLTNSGNAALRAGELSAAQSGTWPVTYSVAGGRAYPTLAEALAAWDGTLQPGETLALRVTVNAPAGLAGGAQDTTTTAVSITPDGGRVSGEYVNTTPEAVSVRDVTTILQGKPQASKTVQSCGTDAGCAAPHDIAGGLVVPGEVLVYTITASNAGDAGLRLPVVRDALPEYVTGVSVQAALSAGVGGQVLYSLDGTTWTATAPDLSRLTSGQTIYVGYDADANGNVTSEDSLPPAGSITVRLIVRVQ